MNQSTMTDEIKRLEKILRDKGGKGFLKPVDNLESSHFVLVEDEKCTYKSLIFKTEDYKTITERGLLTYTPDIVHFLIVSNKRNIRNIKNNLYRNTCIQIFKFDKDND